MNEQADGCEWRASGSTPRSGAYPPVSLVAGEEVPCELERVDSKMLLAMSMSERQAVRYTLRTICHSACLLVCTL